MPDWHDRERRIDTRMKERERQNKEDTEKSFIDLSAVENFRALDRSRSTKSLVQD